MTFHANLERAVAIELQEKALTLYVALLPIVQTVSKWTLNGTDPMLPLPFAVKVQLDAFKALSLPRLKLDEWVTALQQAAPDDTLTYPPPPDTGANSGQFDGSTHFDGSTTFSG
jgi:hypothetical protein